MTLAAAILLCLVVAVAILAPLIAPHDPTQQVLGRRLRPPALFSGGDWTNPLGTDSLGRDFLSRLMYGARSTLLVSLGVVILGSLIGTTVGLIAGYRGGVTDTLVMRLIDLQMAFPGLLLILLVVSVAKPTRLTLVLLLSLMIWHVFARHVRAWTLSARSNVFVEAARMSGARTPRILVRHVLPNLASPLLTLVVLSLATIMLAESSLSFLGLGVQPPNTSWGLEINTGRQYIFDSWWLVVLPGLAISLTVLAVNVLGNWLRVVLDPQQSDKRFVGEQSTGAR